MGREKKETDATGKWTGYKEGDYDATMCCCNSLLIYNMNIIVDGYIDDD